MWECSNEGQREQWKHTCSQGWGLSWGWEQCNWEYVRQKCRWRRCLVFCMWCYDTFAPTLWTFLHQCFVPDKCLKKTTEKSGIQTGFNLNASQMLILLGHWTLCMQDQNIITTAIYANSSQSKEYLAGLLPMQLFGEIPAGSWILFVDFFSPPNW